MKSRTGTAWVFPGQGSQTVGMGKALYDAYTEVRELYEAADEILQYSLSDLCFSGPAERLTQTNHAQPALLATGLAHLQALRLSFPGEFDTARFVAGHSLGEYTALVASEALSFEDGLRLVAERGRLMRDAGSTDDGPTGMSAIIGMPDSELQALCDEADVDLANINAPGQVVISGSLSALEKAAIVAKERGARRVIPLPVSAAFHSRWMRPMAGAFARHIASAEISDPQIQLVANVTARPALTAIEVRDLLEKQTYSSVRWVESVQYMVEHGVTRFVEVGPGKVLSGLVKRIAPDVQVDSSEELLGV
ncbi:MAG: ACP S-malonyltransferase [Chloroflexia bacterium]